MKNCTFISWSKQVSFFDLLPFVHSDILIIEGGKNLICLPRVVLPLSLQEYNELSCGLDLAIWGDFSEQNLQCTNQVSNLANLIKEKAFLLPGLNCGACGRWDCYSMAREIVNGEADPSECVAMNSKISIESNGYQISLNPFVQNLISGALKGMLEPLKGYSPGEIKIHLET